MSGVQSLLSSAGMAALSSLLRANTLFAFDFDGTLAPLVDQPDEAVLPPARIRLLRDIARKAPVAILSGRSAKDVAARLGFTPGAVIGSHGADDLAEPEQGALAQAALAVVRQALAVAHTSLRAAGVSVEDKAQSIALHYRLAADPDLARQTIGEVLAASAAGLHVFGGKCVVNIAPANAPDKGDALRKLAARFAVQTVLYAGDDLNDEPAFASAEPHWLTVKIGAGSPTAARYFVRSLDELDPVLRVIADAVGA